MIVTIHVRSTDLFSVIQGTKAIKGIKEQIYCTSTDVSSVLRKQDIIWQMEDSN